MLSLLTTKKYKNRLGLILLNLGLCLGYDSLLSHKAVSAEEILLNYGPLEFSLSVESLEIYAKEGKITGKLKDYARLLTPEQLDQLQKALVTSAEVTPLAVAQFLYSTQGEKILEQVGQIVQTKARQPGFYAIRSALILSAAEEEGLTPLNILQNFPTYGIRLNSDRGFKIIENLSNIIQRTASAIATVEATALREREAQTLPNTVPVPNFLSPGSVTFRTQTLTLRDRDRNRVFPVELYLPQRQNSMSRLPLVVISHGLGSDRNTFAYLAEHLASHGFAVAVPEHPGSNYRQINALFNGLAHDVTPPEELIDRPKDIKFLLDYLAAEYGDGLDVNHVGIIGQSFGGYTALAVAGAELNFTQLERDCPNLDDSLNVSLLLQCISLNLPEKNYKLEDRRITAAIAINPLTSSIFGEAGMGEIEIPTMIISGSADPVTPALPEQIQPFTWLTTSEKYLALLRGGTHFSTLNESSGSIPVPEQAIGPDPKVARDYVKQLSLIFFATYVDRQSEYKPYLSADYADRISKSLLPLNLVNSLVLE
ncbi:MAG: alpha/beta hydrolase [Xenococcaceae cyanobacterium]